MIRKLPPILLALLVAGCADPQYDEPNVPPLRPSLAGSYDIVLQTVQGYPQGAPESSIGLRLRLDIPEQESTDALLSGGDSWEPTEAVIERTDEEVTVRGCAGTGTYRDSDWWSDRWCTFRLPLDSKGAFTGALLAEGENERWTYHSLDEHPLEAQGSIAPDVTAPSITFIPANYYGSDARLLPWDVILAIVDEGVNADAFVENVRVHTKDSAESTIGPWDLELGIGSVESWAGHRRFQSQLSDWTATGHEMHVVTLLGDVPDPAGNPAVVSAELPWVPLPKPVPAFEFAPDEGVVSWGKSELPSAGNPEVCGCDSQSCATLGPLDGASALLDGGYCAVEGGLAFRIATKDKTTVRFRYRILIDFAAYHESNAGHNAYRVGWITASRSGSEHRLPSPFDVVALETPCGVFSWATPWQTVDVPVEGEGELGVIIGPSLETDRCVPRKERLRMLVVDSVQAL